MRQKLKTLTSELGSSKSKEKKFKESTISVPSGSRVAFKLGQRSAERTTPVIKKRKKSLNSSKSRSKSKEKSKNRSASFKSVSRKSTYTFTKMPSKSSMIDKGELAR